ncbi:MAG: septal ring lytic transglycosylase RlpA family protein, partial [Longimicrobiales bacterium]
TSSLRPSVARRQRLEQGVVRRSIAARGLAAIPAAAALVSVACASARPVAPAAPPPEPNVDTTIGATGDRGARETPVRLDATEDVLATAAGEATYYADMFEGRPTASGVIFSNAEMFAAHREYPFGTVIRVVSVETGREVVVRVVDRLPPPRNARARRTIIDLSQRAARALSFIRAGRIRVRLEVLSWGDERR